jgi:hypothetical protein
MPGTQAISATRVLSPDDKQRLAAIIANMLQPHLRTGSTQAADIAKPANQSDPPNQSICSFKHSVANQGG